MEPEQISKFRIMDHGPHDANRLLSLTYATCGKNSSDDLEPLKPQSRERSSNGTAETTALADTLAATAAGRYPMICLNILSIYHERKQPRIVTFCRFWLEMMRKENRNTVEKC